MHARVLIHGIVVAAIALAHAGCSDDDDGNPSGVGNYCLDDEDCVLGTCFLRNGFGYCASPCEDEGSTSQCPPDSVCKPIQGGERRCLLVCGSESACRDRDDCGDSYCPAGSSCVDVYCAR